MEAILQKIRSRQRLTDAEKAMARQGLTSHARAKTDAAPRQSTKKGDVIDRAAVWRKAMATDGEAKALNPTGPASHKAGVGKRGGRGGKNYAEMWRRGHEKARAMPPIRGDE